MDRPYDGHSRGSYGNQASQTTTGDARKQLPEIKTTNKIVLFSTATKAPKLPDYVSDTNSAKIQIPNKERPPRQKFNFDVHKDSAQLSIPKLTVPPKKANHITLPKVEAAPKKEKPLLPKIEAPSKKEQSSSPKLGIPEQKTVGTNKNIPTPTKQSKLPDSKSIESPPKPKLPESKSIEVKSPSDLETSIMGFKMKDLSNNGTPSSNKIQSPDKVDWLDFEINTLEPIRYSDL